MLSQPHTQALEGSHDHGVEVPGVEGGGAAALEHDVAAHAADRTLALRCVDARLHLETETRRWSRGEHRVGGGAQGWADRGSRYTLGFMLLIFKQFCAF